MIQKGSSLRVIDNSGAKKANCIHVYNGYRKRYANLGDMIKVSIKKVRKGDPELLKVKKGTMSKAVVINVKNLSFQFDGLLKRTPANCIVLISDQNKYVGTRVFSGVDYTLRKSKYLKLLSMGGGIIY